LLLHEVDENNRKCINIVDGQQRLTTSVIFIATALHVAQKKKISLSKEKLLRRNFIFDEDDDSQKFHTIDEDEPFFRESILHISEGATQSRSPSSERLLNASNYFSRNIKDAEWEYLVSILKNSKVMVYAVDNAADATQVFELQNDRGKRLTSLESLKSYLMHSVYLNTKNPDDRLRAMQTQFSSIFRQIEALEGISKKAPSEDSILAYHCVSFLKWSENAWREPKQLIKDNITNLPSDTRIQWIESFVSNLLETYKTVKMLFEKRDIYDEFSELLVLGRMAPFWPLLLKTWAHDSTKNKDNFRKTCRLLEVYAFKGYAISNLRSDSGQNTFYTYARDFTGKYDALHDLIYSMCFWYNLDSRFLSGLDSPNLYNDDKYDALYLLWKYENSKRQQIGNQHANISWREIMEPKKFAEQLSVEHIAAQNNKISEAEVEWEKGKRKLFKEVATHRLGNLVLDSVSPNASKGKADFSKKMKKLSGDTIYLSQRELIEYAEGTKESPEWTIKSVKDRHKKLIEFCIKTWDPKKYHTKSKSDDSSAALPAGEEPQESNP
jgi:hypothetical protein